MEERISIAQEVRLLFFTDVHYRGNNPSSRKDDYPAAIRSKLEQIRKIGEEHCVHAYVDGGDTFDAYDPANSVVYELAEIYKKFYPTSIYKVLGSHETVGYNYSPKTRKQTAAGILEVTGMVRILGAPPRHITEGPNIVVLSGVHHQYSHYETHTFEAFPDGLQYPKHALFVAVVHGMLSLKTIPGPHTLVEDAVVERANVVLSGHNHTPFEHERKDGVRFVNPGSIARASVVENHIPQVAILSYDGTDHHIELIPLSVEEDVFIERAADIELSPDMEEFFEQLSILVRKQEIKDVREAVLYTCGEMGITEKQKALAAEILQGVKQ